jgi:hypothetical protein
MEIEVKCPSGMVGIVRPIKTKDEKLYTDNRLLRSGNILLEICKRTWIKLVDPGPYEFKDSSIEWEKILQGDLLWLFFEVRKISYGPIYEFKCKCAFCDKPFLHSLDLEKDLVTQKFSEESKITYVSKQPFETETEDGKLVKFKALTVADDQKSKRLVDGKGMLEHHASVVQQLISVEGIESNNIFEFIRYIEEMDAGDFDLLRERMDEQSCGIDTDIIVVCADRNCGVEDIVTLPLEATLFQKRKARSLDRIKRKRAKQQQMREQNG